MDNQRQALLDSIEELNGRADELFARHSPEELFRKPSRKSWSIAQCVEHMDTSLGLYLPAFEATLASGAPKGSGPFAWGPIARRWIRLVGPGGPKLPSPPSMWPRRAAKVPASGAKGEVRPGPDVALPDPDALLADFRAGNDRLAGLIRSSDGLDLARIRMRSPVIPVLRFSVGAWFETCVQHSLRHMAQAERLSTELSD